jgi:hypothetical protein
MEQRERDSLVFDDRAGSEWRSSLASGWPVLAVMAIGALLVLGNLVGLLTGSHMDTFGSSGGNGLAGAQLVGLLLGLGLVMHKELARRVYLVFAVIGLVATLLGSSSYTGAPEAYLAGLLVDVGTVAILLHPRVTHAFD